MKLYNATAAICFTAVSLLAQRAPVNLKSAGNYVILTETGITDVPPSVIVGNIGASPITGAAIHLTCTEVTGTISAVDAAGPAPCALQVPELLGPAVLDMQAAYADAAGRTVPDFTELGAGNISGMTLAPGLYKWSTGVMVDNTGITLTGGPNAVWIFQISGDLLLANNAHITLAGGAQANNVFWQVGGPTSVTLGTGVAFAGNLLSSKQVIMNTGATLNGRAYAFTQVTLQSTGITNPGVLVNGIPVVVPPTVSSTAPANLSLGVPVGTGLTASFSETMNPATLTTASFTVKAGLTPVPGTVSYVGVTATFTPSANLAANTLYTATITTTAADPAGVPLAANYVWTFTTGSVPDTTPPTVSSTVPAINATNVPVGNALSATFSEAMNPLTIGTATFTLKQGVTPVTGTVSYVGVTATFTPLVSLAANTLFTATITTGAKDLSGNALVSNYIWTFTTGATPDTTPPTVSSTVPAINSANVPVGNALSATFSEAMNALTIGTATFTLKQGATAVAGSVSYAGVTATFTPLASLAGNSLFTATITTGVQDLSGNALATNYVWTFTTGTTPDTTPPTVSSTVPASNSTNVAVGSALAATFSEAMNPLTISTATFTLKQGATAVAGTVMYAGVTATFTPLVSLAANTLFTATITTGVQDLSGNALVTNYVWTFTTGTTPDITPPTVISTVPASNSTNVAVGSSLSATFSEAMNPLTIGTATFTLKQGATPVPGAVSYIGVTATFIPLISLAANTLFTATITTGAQDLSGNALTTNYVWNFTTAAPIIVIPPTNPPTVISTAPSSGANFVTVTSNLVITFSEAMNPLTINTRSVSLTQGGTAVAATVSYAGVIATLRPASNLAPNSLYEGVVSTEAADLFGNTLASTYLWSFTTSGSTANQTPVCLASFAVLSGSAIVGSGSNAVTGDIGVSPGTSVTGFPPGTLTGTIHAGDAAAAQAIVGFTAAYGDAVSRAVGAVPVSGDLGGQTFTAGLYKSVSSLAISSGNLTLDARGDVNAVFIFQMASTLTTSSGNQIVLAGGAQPFNVFWQVGSSATLGSNSLFKGSILANQSITLNAGATVNGRLLALNGVVTLQSDIVISPSPGIGVGGIVNAASDSRTVAAGSIAAVFGNDLGSALLAATAYPLPASLGGSSFTVGMQSAPLFMTYCSQANLQIPWEAAGQTQVPITATVGGLVSLPQLATVATFAPGIFSMNMAGSGQGAVEIAPTSLLAAPMGTLGRPVAPGEYIAIFCTGLGPVTNQPATGAAALTLPLSYTTTLPTVTLGGVSAQVTYSGLAPGFAGLYQVNVLIPNTAPRGAGVNLVLTIGGAQSNTVTIAIQ